MRRRDAKNDSLDLRYPVRPALVSAAFAVLVHATLLALATVAGFRVGNRHDLIRVWLFPGGGNGAAPGAGADKQTAVAPPAPQMAQAQPANGHHADALRAKPPARHHRPASQMLAPRDDGVPSAAPSNGGGSETGAPGGAGAATAAGWGPPGGGAGGSGTGDGGSGAGDGGDQRAYCVYCPEPHYPLIARARGWQGSVDVRLSVLADGSVQDASLRRSSGYSVLDAAAIAVARRSRFRPPASSGLPAPFRGRIEYRFELTTGR